MPTEGLPAGERVLLRSHAPWYPRSVIWRTPGDAEEGCAFLSDGPWDCGASGNGTIDTGDVLTMCPDILPCSRPWWGPLASGGHLCPRDNQELWGWSLPPAGGLPDHWGSFWSGVCVFVPAKRVMGVLRETTQSTLLRLSQRAPVTLHVDEEARDTQGGPALTS